MTERRKVALIGMGKMGRAVEQLASERGWEVVARITSESNDGGKGVTAASLNGADVAIEFTMPDAAAANARAAIAAGCPIVVGTTGWSGELPSLTTWVEQKKGALLTAPNFSLGVTAFAEIVAVASRLLGANGRFDAHLVETHHAAKKDAPSGTAITLRQAASWPSEIQITSIRLGSVPGIHELIFDAPFETITLTHTARDRRVFAEGALVAAGWLIGRTGVFTMKDVLGAKATAGMT